MNTEKFCGELFGLEGKTAVVVGGTGVLCGAMAKGLWQAGCKVVLVGRNEGKAKAHFEEWGSGEDTARFCRADATNREDIKNVISSACGWFGDIDIWVNGAGINSPTPYLEITDEEFARLLETNVAALHRCCQEIGRHWIGKGRGGSLINVSSMSAVRPLSRVFTYSMTKAAVWNLTQNLAREWAPRGIRVNALCPGFFPAEQNRKVLDESRVKAILGHTPMGRFGEAEELVGAALLLASDRAGGFITGANLVVDGGFAVVSI
ncbi:MAG: SDR family oxidoreductase [bacterium]